LGEPGDFLPRTLPLGTGESRMAGDWDPAVSWARAISPVGQGQTGKAEDWATRPISVGEGELGRGELGL